MFLLFSHIVFYQIKVFYTTRKDFIKYLAPQLKESYIAIDPYGSSRCGYLSADRNNFEKLKTIFKILKMNLIMILLILIDF